MNDLACQNQVVIPIVYRPRAASGTPVAGMIGFYAKCMRLGAREPGDGRPMPIMTGRGPEGSPALNLTEFVNAHADHLSAEDLSSIGATQHKPLGS
jgi:hypothetical protein